MARTKRGRKRQDGERYPSGDLKHPAPAIQKRIAALARQAKDPLLSTQLGWLRIEKVITDQMAQAGVMFASLVGQFDRVMGLPRRSVASPSYETGFSGARSWDSPEAEEHRIVTIKRRYNAAVEAMGPYYTRIVTDVVVDDQAIAWQERASLAQGLQALAAHLGLTRG